MNMWRTERPIAPTPPSACTVYQARIKESKCCYRRGMHASDFVDGWEGCIQNLFACLVYIGQRWPLCYASKHPLHLVSVYLKDLVLIFLGSRVTAVVIDLDPLIFVAVVFSPNRGVSCGTCILDIADTAIPKWHWDMDWLACPSRPALATTQDMASIHSSTLRLHWEHDLQSFPTRHYMYGRRALLYRLSSWLVHCERR